MARIHQFSPAVAAGDGVTGGVLLTQALLRELGHESELYVQYSDGEMHGLTRSYADFDSDICDLLLVHHSMGHNLEDWLLRLTCPLGMVYHNITPAEFFHADSAERRYAILGGQQLARWNTRFCAAIGVSALNRTELDRLGYRNTCVIPLVVSHERLQAVVAAEPPESDEIADRDLILCVGRVAENKRQHLALDALWHLSRLNAGASPLLVIAGGVTSPLYQRQLENRIWQLGLGDHVLFTGKCPDAELRWYYERAKALWCTSAHEGFCVPLIEANAFNLPIFAFAHASIPDTLGGSGMLIEQDDPAMLAAATATVFESAAPAAKLIAAGQHNLVRFQRQTLKQQLHDFIETQLARIDDAGLALP